MSEFTCRNNCGATPFPNEQVRDMHEDRFCPAKGAKSVDEAEAHDAEAGSQAPQVEATAVNVPNATLDVESQAQFLYPKPVKGYRVEDHVRRKMERVLAASERGDPQNVLLIGESATGKTTLAFQLAAMTKRPLAKINMQMISEASQLYGYREANPVEGTRYVLGIFPIAIMQEKAIVVLEDVAHAGDRTITNGLLPALDFTRVVWLDYLGQYVKVARGVIFIGTGNQGHQYGGASKLDRALVSRFDNRIHMSHPPVDIVCDILIERTGCKHTDASRLAQLAEGLREDRRSPVTIDLRGLLAAAQDMAYGANFFEAVTYTLLGDLSEQQIDDLKFRISDGMSEYENQQAAQGANKWREWR